MKKLLAVTIALMMILCCVPVYADDATGVILIATKDGLISSAPVWKGESEAVQPSGMLWTENGVFVTDVFNKQIYLETTKGSSVVAGKLAEATYNGAPAATYKDAAAREAGFAEPWAIASFLDGYAISDPAVNAVRYYDGKDVKTIKNGLNNPTGLASDGTNLYIADTGNGKVLKIN